MNVHALLVAVIGAAALVVTASPPAVTGGPRPVLVVSAALAPADTSSDDEDRAMALAVASIAPDERARILDQMRYTTARLEARLSPLGSDFGDDDDPVASFRATMAAHLPTFTAARAFERGQGEAGSVAARVAASCAEAALAPGETCVPLWTDEEDPRDGSRTARLAVWAASHAAIVDLGSAAAADACAAALRTRATDPASPVALVVTRDDLALRPVAERDELQDAARLLGRAMAANAIEDHSHLDAFARAAPQGRATPWLTLRPTELAIVPRLSALGRKKELTAEVRAAAGGAPLAWTHEL